MLEKCCRYGNCLNKSINIHKWYILIFHIGRNLRLMITNDARGARRQTQMRGRVRTVCTPAQDRFNSSRSDQFFAATLKRTKGNERWEINGNVTQLIFHTFIDSSHF